MSASAPWLVVMNMQHCFADPQGEWFVPGYADVVRPVERLIAASEGRVVLTRFVSGSTDMPGWSSYHALWPTMQKPDTDAAWELTVDALAAAEVVTDTTFSKWAAVAHGIPPEAPIVVCGVATDVCVLSTILDAVDEGRSVVVALTHALALPCRLTMRPCTS